MAGQQKQSNLGIEEPPEAPEEPSAAEEAVVRYVGSSDVREITAAQWKKAGVEDQKKVVWDKSNRHAVPSSEFSKEALAVLRADSGFKLSGD